MIEYNHASLKLYFITLFFMCFSLQESEDEFPNSSLPEETNLNETLGGTFLTLDEIGVFLSCLVGGNGN